MNMFMLAELTSKWDFSGIWCLASIGFLIIALLAYSTGPYSGSCICLFFFVIAVLATGDMGDAGSGSNMTPSSAYITNLSQTKVLERYKYSINNSNCIFFDIKDSFGHSDLDREFIFIPAEEMYIGDDSYKMKSNDKSPHLYDMIEFDEIKEFDWGKSNSRAEYYLYKNKNGVIVKVNTGKVPTDDSYYMYDRTISPINVSTKDGGWGVPEWIYHPASSVYVFGIMGLPSLMVVGYIKNIAGR